MNQAGHPPSNLSNFLEVGGGEKHFRGEGGGTKMKIKKCLSKGKPNPNWDRLYRLYTSYSFIKRKIISVICLCLCEIFPKGGGANNFGSNIHFTKF